MAAHADEQLQRDALQYRVHCQSEEVLEFWVGDRGSIGDRCVTSACVQTTASKACLCAFAANESLVACAVRRSARVCAYVCVACRKIIISDTRSDGSPRQEVRGSWLQMLRLQNDLENFWREPRRQTWMESW